MKTQRRKWSILLLLSMMSLFLHAQTEKNALETNETKTEGYIPFVFNTHSNVTIERIVSDNAATSLHMLVYQRRNNWIRISSETYIHAGGKKYPVKSADGIQLDTEVYPDESEKIIFSLTFPPLDAGTQQIDFVESDCDDCFKIFGLRLNPDAGNECPAVPEKIKKAAIIKDDGKPLSVPRLKAGNATLKGKLAGYAPLMKTSVKVYVDNPLTGIQETNETDVKDDGTFNLKIPLITSMQALLRISLPWYNKYILLSPGKESTVYVDLQQKSYQETPIEALRRSPGKYIYFGGAHAEINNQMEDINMADLLHKTFHNNADNDMIVGMTAEHFKTYIENKANNLIADLEQKRLTQKALDFASGWVRYEAARKLMFTDDYLQNAYRRFFKIEYGEPLPGFTPPEINEDFYSFLKELSINDPYSLYFHQYGNIINSCKYLVNKGIRINYVSKEAFQALINSGKLFPEDLTVAGLLRDQAIDNPGSPKKEFEKQKTAMFISELIATGKLNDKYLEQANQTLQICMDTSTASLTAITQQAILMKDLSVNNLITLEEMADVAASISNKLQDADTTGAVSKEQEAAFHEKYAEEMKPWTKKQQWDAKKSSLARILGTDKGLALDLMETQLACTQWEEYTPLTADEIQAFFKKKDTFYFRYITAKNNKLLAQIEENKCKGAYTIYDIPETNGEQAFSEIVKKFEGKVILVDFWGTWCGPCRAAMKKFEPKKNIYKEKGVIFVYLADETSPLDTWNNMIPGISGEHYRLKNRQMEELKKKFGITGVPAYLILNKRGEQIYFKVSFRENEIENKLTEAL